ncbi:hypothetical protein HGI81_03725 [Olsenella sp. KGMB02461]|nr:hypothetical protein [Olsenella sp. KGMB02461]
MKPEDAINEALRQAGLAIAADPEALTCNTTHTHRCMDDDDNGTLCMRMEILAYQSGYCEIRTNSRWGFLVEED